MAVHPAPGRIPAKRGEARARLLEAAARRFYVHGVAATGIDAITSDAGVAKMSLYKNFANKDDLVAAYLEDRHATLLQLYRRRLAEARSPRYRVLAVFDAYLDHAALAYEADFRGCGLLNAAAELPSRHPGRAAVRRHKEEIENLLLEHLKELAPRDPEWCRGTAEHLSFLLEGAMVRAGLDGGDRRLRRARDLASGLLDNR
ncbi:TetR/AcrR family transcriptional regulator [Arthrobacter sp. I2-34]|uniref:TetR/AcrR family transcriptional regulator n=1 Tax=Arthrobacter hankyongi TaxID=2904801 RepID=A0ABS9L4T7_9MICC|nr:TetR/AcrR family transcriptional regulator [Arthrobacter hankyongi]MCG2621694.1 TetR/AcrR family transcriptional regulator [Arthrobacter hankyongi]